MLFVGTAGMADFQNFRREADEKADNADASWGILAAAAADAAIGRPSLCKALRLSCGIGPFPVVGTVVLLLPGDLEARV
jgi:hypothetical protein